jgi:hypothetical protein
MQNLQNIIASMGSEHNTRMIITRGRYGEHTFVFLTRQHPDASGNDTERALDVLLTGSEDDYHAIMAASEQLPWLPITHHLDLTIAMQVLADRVGTIKPEDLDEWWRAYEHLVDTLLDVTFVVQPLLAQMQTPAAALAILPPAVEDNDSHY